MTTEQFIDKALSADGLQDAIKKAELSDTIFEALSDTYSYTVKMKYDEKRQREALEKAFHYCQFAVPKLFHVTPKEAVEIFFNRLYSLCKCFKVFD